MGDIQSINSLSQNESSRRPILKTGSNGINNKNVVRFDGVDDYLTTGTSEYSTINEPYTFFVVFEAKNTGINEQMLDSGSTTHHIFGHVDSGGYIIRQGTSITGGAADKKPNIATIIYDTGDDILRINGSQILKDDSGGRSNDGITVGANPAEKFYANVDIAEIILYDKKLDIPNIEKVESVLSADYSINL